ncbi:hypothetical protein OOZ54_12585 [Rhodopseudomonas palustris]|uniref:hypothetical protein n=1 Tax=Rhodopseudomonas palustris TaxID=1076 RepID=UPI0022F03940|nr:hypothetical protein [Rhodopseudomonas palustris]WBU27531.1 hypothetical protein OOZ54_12585 [Rhodopseudomonas palustris]
MGSVQSIREAWIADVDALHAVQDELVSTRRLLDHVSERADLLEADLAKARTENDQLRSRLAKLEAGLDVIRFASAGARGETDDPPAPPATASAPTGTETVLLKDSDTTTTMAGADNEAAPIDGKEDAIPAFLHQGPDPFDPAGDDLQRTRTRLPPIQFLAATLTHNR